MFHSLPVQADTFNAHAAARWLRPAFRRAALMVSRFGLPTSACHASRNALKPLLNAFERSAMRLKVWSAACLNVSLPSKALTRRRPDRNPKPMVCSFRYENSRVVSHPTARLSDGWTTRRPAWTFRRHVRRPCCSATLSGRCLRIETIPHSTGSHCSPCRPRASCCFRRRTW